jgi:hypothetical protein
VSDRASPLPLYNPHMVTQRNRLGFGAALLLAGAALMVPLVARHAQAEPAADDAPLLFQDDEQRIAESAAALTFDPEKLAVATELVGETWQTRRGGRLVMTRAEGINVYRLIGPDGEAFARIASDTATGTRRVAVHGDQPVYVVVDVRPDGVVEVQCSARVPDDAEPVAARVADWIPNSWVEVYTLANGVVTPVSPERFEQLLRELAAFQMAQDHMRGPAVREMKQMDAE